MVVYADVVWLLNVCIDFLLLLLTAVILKKKVKKWRLIAGALLGSTIVIFAFTSFAYTMTHPVTKMLYSLLMVYTVFGFTKIRTFIQTLCMFYFVTFMVGGGMLGLHFFMRASPFIQNSTTVQTSAFGDPISWSFVVVGCPIIYYFSKQRIGDIEITKIRYDQIVKVEVVIGEQREILTGLIDNGNQLYDPLTRTPVMIVEAAMTQLFPAWLQEQAKHVTSFPELGEGSEEWIKRIRMIPYRGIGQNHQFLLAVKPDVVQVYVNEEIRLVQHVLIGLSHTKLSTDNEYTCILHPKMLLSTTA